MAPLWRTDATVFVAGIAGAAAAAAAAKDISIAAVVVVASEGKTADGNIVAAADVLCCPTNRDFYDLNCRYFWGLRTMDPSSIRERQSWSCFELIG